ncbi:hypothetical protein P4V41_08040 [Fictibacillus nanhaiensis]|uniref:hypothetical protein n=1 Tax=Fictibacillus nanhaiensis TaxID=742169 RepID=UPI002E1C87D1|nr:hypothetical protein [Fictibacillus nanhaiensis]
MEVLATAKLGYWTGESIIAGRERLELIVKFKEKGLFKTKLKKTLVSTWQINQPLAIKELKSIDDYFDECEKYLRDEHLVRKEAEKMVIKYFKEKFADNKRDIRSGNIQDRVHKRDKIEVKVSIK